MESKGRQFTIQKLERLQKILNSNKNQAYQLQKVQKKQILSERLLKTKLLVKQFDQKQQKSKRLKEISAERSKEQLKQEKLKNYQYIRSLANNTPSKGEKKIASKLPSISKIHLTPLNTDRSNSTQNSPQPGRIRRFQKKLLQNFPSQLESCITPVKQQFKKIQEQALITFEAYKISKKMRKLNKHQMQIYNSLKMEVFEAILTFLDARKFPKTADSIRSLLQTTSPQLDQRKSHQIINLIEGELGPADNNSGNQGISEENEAVMEALMTKLITSNTVAQSQAVEKNIEKLFEIKAFQKMVSCADQLFFEGDSMNLSSRVAQQSDDSLPHFGRNDDNSEVSDYSQPQTNINDDDELMSSSIQNNESNTDNDSGMVQENQSNDEIDEYEDDDDPGYDAYECNEEDFVLVSKKLADKYGFPQRASRPRLEGEPKAVVQKDAYEGENGSLLPPEIKFPSSNDDYYPKEFDGVIYDCFKLKVISDREKTGFEETKDIPLVPKTILAGRYQIIEYLGSAAFSKAIQCLDLRTQEMVCIKIIENNKDYVDQSVDEIKLLNYIQCNGDCDEMNVIKVFDYFYHREHLFIVTELLRDNLYEFYKYNREHEDEFYFTIGRIQKIAYQILIGLQYIHSLKLIHCDLKPENILIKSYSKCEVKVIDFGSSCYIHDHLSSYVQSRSYRAPEVIMGCKYDYKIDIWSLGCILAELWTGNVLFQNETVQGLLARVVGIMGPFPEECFKTGRLVSNFFTREKLLYQEASSDERDNRHLSDEMIELINQHRQTKNKVQILVPKRTTLNARLRTDDTYFLDFVGKLLDLNPNQRLSASQALKHPFITERKYPDGL